MKRTALLSIILIFSVVVSAQTNPPASAGTKVGYVNLDKILQEFPEAIQADGQLKALEKTYKSELDSLVADLQEQVAQFQKQQGNMPEKQKTDLQVKLVNQNKYIEDLQAQRRDELLKKQSDLFKPIKEKVYAMVDVIAKEEGMNMVLDRSSDALVVYADANLDITYEVLIRLKKGNK